MGAYINIYMDNHDCLTIYKNHSIPGGVAVKISVGCVIVLTITAAVDNVLVRGDCVVTAGWTVDSTAKTEAVSGEKTVVSGGNSVVSIDRTVGVSARETTVVSTGKAVDA